MQFSEHWLRRWVNPALNTDELAHVLTMAGLEVDETVPVGVRFSGVVVAEIIAVAPHPNADRLAVCQVDVGEAAPLQIVCGAPNVRAGLRVPCARVGAQLPAISPDRPPIAITAVTMRGVQSNGMLCAASELQLPDSQKGILELSQDTVIGEDLFHRFALDDTRWTLKVTPNRADCLSMLGIAREVAALTGAPLSIPPLPTVPVTIPDAIPIVVQDLEACGLFSARVIRNVRADAMTPDWMRHCIERAGQRCVSALVDITNYVMLEHGCPLHVYDLERVQTPLQVRFAKADESLHLLNGRTVALQEDVLIIADATGPVGLAGIMGGETTKAELTTTDLVLEAAFFTPNVIAGRARRYQLPSEAAYRFERGVDVDQCEAALARATELILTICGGQAGPVVEVAAPRRAPLQTRMRVARAQKIIGAQIPRAEMADIFTRLGLEYQLEEGDASPTADGVDAAVFILTTPAFRFDLRIEEDFIEEIARVYGYERIPVRPPVAAAAIRVPQEQTRSLHALRLLLAHADYHEVINFSFVPEESEQDFAANVAPIVVINPIASPLNTMRSSLIGGLVSNLQYNMNRKQSRVRVFEIGRVFLRDPHAQDGPFSLAGLRQPHHIAGLAWGSALPEQWGLPNRAVDFFDLKADVTRLLAPAAVCFVRAVHPALHPGRSARIDHRGQAIGWLGELHPQWVQKYHLPSAPIVFELDAALLLKRALPTFLEPSKFPPVRRDLALVVQDTVVSQTLVDALFAVAPAMVSEIVVFDVYTGNGIAAGYKSLALRIGLRDTQKTLTDQVVDEVIATLLAEASRGFGAQLRNG